MVRERNRIRIRENRKPPSSSNKECLLNSVQLDFAHHNRWSDCFYRQTRNMLSSSICQVAWPHDTYANIPSTFDTPQISKSYLNATSCRYCQLPFIQCSKCSKWRPHFCDSSIHLSEAAHSETDLTIAVALPSEVVLSKDFVSSKKLFNHSRVIFDYGMFISLTRARYQLIFKNWFWVIEARRSKKSQV